MMKETIIARVAKVAVSDNRPNSKGSVDLVIEGGDLTKLNELGYKGQRIRGGVMETTILREDDSVVALGMDVTRTHLSEEFVRIEAIPAGPVPGEGKPAKKA